MYRIVRGWAMIALIGLGASASAQENAKPLTKIVFGSCADQNKPCPIWEKIVEQKPELMILLGDNIYADIEEGRLVTVGPDKIAKCYQELAALPAFKTLRESTKILATWDDHDYGHNDAGVEFPHKVASQKLFLDFFGVPADSPRRKREGVYHAEILGPPGKRVQVIMLDARYHRSKLERGPRRRFPQYNGAMITPYIPNEEPGATLLGEEQWKWFAEQLKQPAELRLIGSGIQVVSEDHPFEKWMNIPAERARFYQTIRDAKADGVVILSGDRHHGEISVAASKHVGYPLFDITSSGFNQASKKWRAPEINTQRLATMPYGDNFGVVRVDWSEPDPTVTLELRDSAGEVVAKHTVPLHILKADPAAIEPEAPKLPLPEGVVPPANAAMNVGKMLTVQFFVKGGRAVQDGKRILLNSEADFREKSNFTVVVNESAMTGPFEKANFDTFKNKTIRATGKVTLFKDAPQIQINDAKQLEIVEK